MNKKNEEVQFKKLDQQQLDDNSGGAAMIMAAIVAAVPLINKLVNTGVNAYKTITSDSGSSKTADQDFKWENHKESSPSKVEQKVVYYAY